MRLKLISALFLVCLFFLNAFAQTVDQTVLDKILQRAEETHSSSVLIKKDGKIIGEFYAGDKNEKIELMSCTKSVVGLAIGKLIEQGKIKSVDQPVYEFYPEWKQGRKALITVKHLLNHTSGLQNVVHTGVEIYPSKDFIKLSLAAELSDEPGTKYSYNNKAVNLLAGIIQTASGKRMDIYIADEILTPLEITNYAWTLDGAGNPHAMAGLQISAADFIKFGELVLNGGKFGGRQIIGEKWLEMSFAQSQPFDDSSGLLWWRMVTAKTLTIDDEQLEKLEKAGFEPEFLGKLSSIKDKIYNGMEEIGPALTEVFGKDWQMIFQKQNAGKQIPVFKRLTVKIEGYYTTGSHGQYLVIIPEKNLTAVRQVKWNKDYNSETDVFNDFMPLIMQLAK